MKRSLALTAAVILSSCATLPPSDQRLIGTWQFSAAIPHHKNGSDTRIAMEPTMEITFTADHKEIWRDRSTEKTATARWHLEGPDLGFTTVTRSFWGSPGITRRERIVKLTPDELIVGDATMSGVWRRVR